MDELSYLDLLTKLKADLETDVLMPSNVKKVALKRIAPLFELLFPYSA